MNFMFLFVCVLKATHPGLLKISGLQEGVYTFQMTVTDTSGQMSSDNVSVTVLAPKHQAEGDVVTKTFIFVICFVFSSFMMHQYFYMCLLACILPLPTEVSKVITAS